MRNRRLHFRTLAIALAAAALAGCSLLLNSGIDGHPCGPAPEYACLDGFACSAGGICVAAAKAACSPACGNGQQCVRQQCVGICNGLACPPATQCGTETCNPVAPGDSAGSPCSGDSDCSNGLFCLLPYTGGESAKGVCTTVCTKSRADGGAADSCAEAGEVCTTFPSDTPTGTDDGIDLCAAPGFTPCWNDLPCASSGLVCSTLYANTPSGYASAGACVSPIANGASAGNTCVVPEDGAAAQQCSSGLCIIASVGLIATNRYCTTPCANSNDCSAIASATCASVAVVEQSGIPRTRAQLCIVGSPSLGHTCAPGQGGCTGDAPVCVPLASAERDAGLADAGPADGGPSDGGSTDAGLPDAGLVDAGPAPDAGSICAPYCTDGLITQCPSAGSQPLSCITESGNPNVGVCN